MDIMLIAFQMQAVRRMHAHVQVIIIDNVSKITVDRSLVITSKINCSACHTLQALSLKYRINEVCYTYSSRSSDPNASDLARLGLKNIEYNNLVTSLTISY